MKTDPTSPWRTVKEAAAYLKCGPKVVYQACTDNRLKHVHITGRRAVRIHVDWLDDFLRAQTVTVNDSQ